MAAGAPGADALGEALVHLRQLGCELRSHLHVKELPGQLGAPRRAGASSAIATAPAAGATAAATAAAAASSHAVFHGSDAVNWLVGPGGAPSRADAVLACRRLLAFGFIISCTDDLFDFDDGPSLFRFSDEGFLRTPRGVHSTALSAVALLARRLAAGLYLRSIVVSFRTHDKAFRGSDLLVLLRSALASAQVASEAECTGVAQSLLAMSAVRAVDDAPLFQPDNVYQLQPEDMWHMLHERHVRHTSQSDAELAKLACAIDVATPRGGFVFARREYYDAWSGAGLVTWLMRRNLVHAHTRSAAVAMCARLIELGLLRSLTRDTDGQPWPFQDAFLPYAVVSSAASALASALAKPVLPAPTRLRAASSRPQSISEAPPIVSGHAAAAAAAPVAAVSPAAAAAAAPVAAVSPAAAAPTPAAAVAAAPAVVVPPLADDSPDSLAMFSPAGRSAAPRPVAALLDSSFPLGLSLDSDPSASPGAAPAPPPPPLTSAHEALVLATARSLSATDALRRSPAELRSAAEAHVQRLLATQAEAAQVDAVAAEAERAAFERETIYAEFCHRQEASRVRTSRLRSALRAFRADEAEAEVLRQAAAARVQWEYEMAREERNVLDAAGASARRVVETASTVVPLLVALAPDEQTQEAQTSGGAAQQRRPQRAAGEAAGGERLHAYSPRTRRLLQSVRTPAAGRRRT